MNFCTKCGNDVRGSKFCTKCGAPTDLARQYVPQSQKKRGIFGKAKEERERLAIWQSYITYGKPVGAQFSKEKLAEYSLDAYNRHLKMARESADLFQKTVKTDVFFGRYNHFIESARFIVGLAEFIELPDNNVAESLRYAENNFEEICNDFIMRAFSRAADDVQNLKTEKAKMKRYLHFFEDIEMYRDEFPSRSFSYFQDIKIATMENNVAILSYDILND